MQYGMYQEKLTSVVIARRCGCARHTRANDELKVNLSWVCMLSRYKKHEIPIEKLYTKWQQPKILWAIETADKHYRFD